jgi:hypothetical protein
MAAWRPTVELEHQGRRSALRVGRAENSQSGASETAAHGFRAAFHDAGRAPGSGLLQQRIILDRRRSRDHGTLRTRVPPVGFTGATP